MKTLILLLIGAVLGLAQTTIQTVNPIRDQQGTVIAAGSLCLGASFGNPTTCQPIANGLISSFSIANGSYAVWLNEGQTTIYTSSAQVSLTGTTVSADSYFSGQFAVSVGGTYTYLKNYQVTTTTGLTVPIPLLAVIPCASGQTITLPADPVSQQPIFIANTSLTATCTVNGNGASIIYQGANVSPASLTAKLSAEIVYSPGTGWVVTHLGS